MQHLKCRQDAAKYQQALKHWRVPQELAHLKLHKQSCEAITGSEYTLLICILEQTDQMETNEDTSQEQER